MGGMKTLMIVALALVAGLAVLALRRDGSLDVNALDPLDGPSFVVEVQKARSSRPLFGLLPAPIEEKMVEHGDLRFSHQSPGAEIGSIRCDRIELRADGWDLLIEVEVEAEVEAETEGQIGSGTYLVFPLVLAGKPRTLRCRPDEDAVGYLYTTARAGSDTLDGRFELKLAACELAETGEAIDWPSSPLTVRGSFVGLRPRRR
jgi:hypothetical protein